MEKTQILNDVQSIFRNVLDNDEIVISFNTIPADIDEWDSLSHIQLIVATEKHFNIKFLSQELVSWEKVGDMIDCISTKI